jgi:hypothetical protein
MLPTDRKYAGLPDWTGFRGGRIPMAFPLLPHRGPSLHLGLSRHREPSREAGEAREGRSRGPCARNPTSPIRYPDGRGGSPDVNGALRGIRVRVIKSHWPDREGSEWCPNSNCGLRNRICAFWRRWPRRRQRHSIWTWGCHPPSSRPSPSLDARLADAVRRQVPVGDPDRLGPPAAASLLKIQVVTPPRRVSRRGGGASASLPSPCLR